MKDGDPSPQEKAAPWRRNKKQRQIGKAAPPGELNVRVSLIKAGDFSWYPRGSVIGRYSRTEKQSQQQGGRDLLRLPKIPYARRRCSYLATTKEDWKNWHGRSNIVRSDAVYQRKRRRRRDRDTEALAQIVGWVVERHNCKTLKQVRENLAPYFLGPDGEVRELPDGNKVRRAFKEYTHKMLTERVVFASIGDGPLTAIMASEDTVNKVRRSIGKRAVVGIWFREIGNHTTGILVIYPPKAVDIAELNYQLILFMKGRSGTIVSPQLVAKPYPGWVASCRINNTTTIETGYCGAINPSTFMLFETDQSPDTAAYILHNLKVIPKTQEQAAITQSVANSLK